MPNNTKECVGSLLIPVSDVQELSASRGEEGTSKTTTTTTNLQKRKTTPVGTLFVSPTDLESSSRSEQQHDHDAAGAGAGAGAGVGEEEGPIKSIQRRITNKLTGPAPKDSEADTWAD